MMRPTPHVLEDVDGAGVEAGGVDADCGGAGEALQPASRASVPAARTVRANEGVRIGRQPRPRRRRGSRRAAAREASQIG